MNEPPSWPLSDGKLSVSLERRRSTAGETLLVFNESWSPRQTRLRFTRAGGPLTLWDPRTGSQLMLRERVKAGDVVAVELEPAETQLLTLGLGDESDSPP